MSTSIRISGYGAGDDARLITLTERDLYRMLEDASREKVGENITWLSISDKQKNGGTKKYCMIGTCVRFTFHLNECNLHVGYQIGILYKDGYITIYDRWSGWIYSTEELPARDKICKCLRRIYDKVSKINETNRQKAISEKQKIKEKNLEVLKTIKLSL